MAYSHTLCHCLQAQFLAEPDLRSGTRRCSRIPQLSASSHKLLDAYIGSGALTSKHTTSCVFISLPIQTDLKKVSMTHLRNPHVPARAPNHLRK